MECTGNFLTNKICVCILSNIYEKAQMGKSNRRKADREQPGGERRMRNLCEYLPELRTESCKDQ